MLEPSEFILEFPEGSRTSEGDGILERPCNHQPLRRVVAFVQLAIFVVTDLLEDRNSCPPERIIGNRGGGWRSGSSNGGKFD